MKRLYLKNILCFILLIAVVVTATAYSVAPMKASAAATDTIVTNTSPGGYDDYTTAVNKMLGITGSSPKDLKSGDTNFEFSKPTVEFKAIDTIGSSRFVDSYEVELLLGACGINHQHYSFYETYFKLYENKNIYLQASEFDNASSTGINIYLHGIYNTQEETRTITLNKSDFIKFNKELFYAPLTKWLNCEISEAFYADGTLTSCEIKSTGCKFMIAEASALKYETSLNFNLKLKNSDLRYLDSLHNYYYFFDLWRDNGTQSQQLITRYIVYSNRIGEDNNLGEYVVAKKDFTYSKGKLEISPSQKVDIENSNTSFASLVATNGYEIIQSYDFIKETDNGAGWSPLANEAYLHFDLSSGTPTLQLQIKTDDYDAKYRCYFGYKTEKAKTVDDYFLFIKTGSHSVAVNDRAGCIWTVATSVADILEAHEEADTLATTYTGTELTAANKILNDKRMQTVTLEMLEQIEGTPFARKVRKTITLPVRNGNLSYDSICQALGFSTLNCLNSNVESVVTINSEGIYELVYLSAVWLHTASVSGASVDSFLNLNENYEEFYNRQTGFSISRDQNGRIITGDADPNKAVITKGTYEYFLNEIKNKYPQLEKYNGNEIYGYWGFFAIPQEFNLDAAWKEVFGTSTQYKNVAHYFKHDVKLSNEAYNMLLKDYGHNYLSRVFNGIAGGALGYDATYYMVYVDDAGYAAASDNGTTDPDGDGLVTNGVQEVTGKVGEILSGLTHNILDFINGGIVGNISTILIIALVIVVVVALIKSGIFSKKNNGNRRKKK